MSLSPEFADKVMTLSQAVSRWIPHGTQLCLGGFTVARNPMALIYEIVRQNIRDLHLVCHSNGQALDLLIGAGCVRRLEIAYAGNGRYAPTCVRFRQALERGELICEDYSNLQMSLRFFAGALGLPFIPCPSGLGSDLLTQHGFDGITRQQAGISSAKFAMIDDPFCADARPTVVLPALTPEVAILHAQLVGDDATVRIKGLTFADLEQAKAARTLIVTCERIVPRAEIRRDPDQNALPGFMVDAVIEVPYGAHPTSCFGHYDVDPKHLKHYRQAAGDDATFAAYLEEWVHGVPDHAHYVAKLGEERLLAIQADPLLGYAVGLDRR